MRCFLLAVFAACATQAFVLPSRPAAVVTRCSAVSVPAVSMNSLDKKKKAMNQKAKSSRSVTKRFKATATGKLLRRRPFRQHLLTRRSTRSASRSCAQVRHSPASPIATWAAAPPFSKHHCCKRGCEVESRLYVPRPTDPPRCAMRCGRKFSLFGPGTLDPLLPPEKAGQYLKA